MSLLVALLLAAAPAPAATTSTTAVPPVTVQISSEVIDWLKVYPLAPYHETWTMDIEVKDFDRDFPRVMEAIEKQGGRLAVPLQNSVGSPSEGSRQLVYQLDEKSGKAALKALKKVGKYEPPLIRPSGEKLPIPEISKKIASLTHDKDLHAAELASMPAVSSLVDAVLAHLVTARSVSQKLETQVTLDLTVRTKGK